MTDDTSTGNDTGNDDNDDNDDNDKDADAPDEAVLAELDDRIAAIRSQAEEAVEGLADHDADTDDADTDTDDGQTDTADDGDEAETAHVVETAERRIAISFVVATLAALGLAGVYVAGGQAQAEGALLFLSLGGVGIGLVLWGRHLLGDEEVTDQRKDLEASDEERDAIGDALDTDQPVGRRKFLGRLLGGAAAALGLAALFPVRSLGPSPGSSLRHTAWRPGVRLIDQEGRLVRTDSVERGSIVTVFPEGQTEAADAQAVLVKVDVEEMRHRPGRETWTPEGNVAYSKICTHVGCPVGLYQEPTHELVCPCHQSTFDVLDGARPLFGPATRSLPQLPLGVDPEGFLVAQGDFDEPVGPGYWTRDR